MSRKDELNALGAEIFNAQSLAKELGLPLVTYLLAMAHLELIEREAEYNGERNTLEKSEGNRAS